jgi:hypothetical protein
MDEGLSVATETVRLAGEAVEADEGLLLFWGAMDFSIS